MGMLNGILFQILPANKAIFCGVCPVAYVVYVVLNAFVCTQGRIDYGQVSGGGCTYVVRTG
jgi:hypothetical protein